MSKLSIIVPVYNTEKYLPRCLDSIKNQSFSDFEVVLIDDGSTDNSGRICDEYSKKDDRFIVIHQQNKGLSGARNVGIERIKNNESSYISFIDSDDYLHPDLYSELLSVMDELTDFVSCDFFFDRSGTILPYKSFDSGSDGKATIHKALLDGYGGNVWNKIFRKSIIIDNNLRFPAISPAEDVVFVCEYLFFVKVPRRIEKNLYYYNQNNVSSLTVANYHSVQYETDYLKGFNQLKQFFEINGVLQMYEKELNWRVQLLKSDWILQPSKYGKYYATWPESRKYTLSNPFLHKKMKIAMWLLDHHISLPLRVASRIMHKKSIINPLC